MYTTNRLDPMGGPTIGFVSWFRNGVLGGLRSGEELPNDNQACDGSNKGHHTRDAQYSCGLVGCHLRRKVVEFAVSHETHNPKVGGSNPPPATNLKLHIFSNSTGSLPKLNEN